MISKLLKGAGLVLLVALLGCGGSSNNGGSGGGTGEVLPKVTINWPDTTRNFGASKFAASARIRVTPAAVGGQTAFWSVDRPAGTSAQTRTYTGTDLKVTGPVQVTVEFASRTGGTGDNVAVAAISGRISSDGTISDSEGKPLGTIASQGVISRIVATGNHPNSGEILTTVNSSQKVVVSGVTANSSIIALDQQQMLPRLTSSVVTGSTFATIQGFDVTGVAEGMAMVRFTLDGMTADVRAWVSPVKVTPRLLDVQASAVAYDYGRNKFWAAFGPDGPNANSLAQVDPSTGAVGAKVDLGGEANLVAISSDGSRAYAGIPGAGAVRYISLNQRLVISSVLLNQEGPGVATAIAVNPNNPNQAAVTVKGSASSANWGPVIINESAALPDYVQGGYSPMSHVAYLDDATLVGASGQTSEFPGARATVGLTGCTLSGSTSGLLPGYGMTSLIAKNGHVVTSQGTVFNAVGLTPVAQLDYNDGSGTMNSRASFVATDESSQFVWLLYTSNSFNSGGTCRLRSVNTSNWTLGSAVTVENVLGDVKGLHRFGTTGIAIHTSQGIYAIDSAPGF